MNFYQKLPALLVLILGVAFVAGSYEQLRDAIGVPKALLMAGLAMSGVYYLCSSIVVTSVKKMLRSRNRDSVK